jgi:DNA-binding response OmpR family regulator
MAPSTILLIDDDHDSIAIYSLILSHHGFNVIHALDSATGLQLATEEKPDIVVSEIFLKDLGGVRFLDLLHAKLRPARTPVIVLDSTPALGRLDASFAAPNRLTKPCEPSLLLKEVNRLLQQRSILD